MRFQTAGVVVGMMLSLALVPQAQADVITEGVITLRCTEASDITIPKKLVLTHMVGLDDFGALGQVALIVTGGYEGGGSVKTGGKVIATATLVKPDDTEIALGRVKAKLKRGEFERLKIIAASVAKGDRIRWRVKNKGMPMLRWRFDECWELELLLGIADEIPN